MNSDRVNELERQPWPEVDRQLCGWNRDSELLLAERFIEEMGLSELYDKFLDIQAAEELSEPCDDCGELFSEAALDESGRCQKCREDGDDAE